MTKDGDDQYQAMDGGDLGWYIYDQANGRSLLGHYSTQGIAERNARRMNAGINFSPNKMRAIKALANLGSMSLASVYSQFKGGIMPQTSKTVSDAISREFEGHGLAKIKGDYVFITDWGREWLGYTK